MLFSSVAGAVGSAGQAGYAAANAYLDALAAARHARGEVATSIAWGPWAGGGMASGHDRLGRAGMSGLDPDTALTALRHAIDRDDAAPIVADVDWDVFGPAFTANRPSALISGLFTPAVRDEGPGLADRLAPLPAADRERAVLDLVRAQAAGVLGHAGASAIGPNRAFKELGFSSLSAVDLCNRLRRATGRTLPKTLVFDYPTPAVLAAYILGLLFETEDPEDARLRAALGNLPLARLREAGLAETLLRLAEGRPEEPEQDGEEIDEMDTEALIRMALGNHRLSDERLTCGADDDYVRSPGRRGPALLTEGDRTAPPAEQAARRGRQGTDRHRRDGLPVPRRGPLARGPVAARRRRRGRRHRLPAGPGLGPGVAVRPRPGRPRHVLRPRGRLPRRRGRLRRGVLRGLAP